MELEKFKTIVKKQKRILAKKYHPDKTGNEDDTKIKEIHNVIDVVMKLEIIIIKRPPPMRFHFSNITPINTTTDSETASNFTFFFHRR